MSFVFFATTKGGEVLSLYIIYMGYNKQLCTTSETTV